MSEVTEAHFDSLSFAAADSPHAAYLRFRWYVEVFFILLFSPLLLSVTFVVALVVLLDTGLPILYFQDRPGRNGKIFRIAKFRTMRNRSVEDEKVTVDNDPRVTKYGAFLRLHRLDEIPQFWNVLRGQMSIIGPRPEPYYAAREYSVTVPHYTERYAIAPGITGWQQVMQGHVNTYEGTCIRVEFDRYYIANASFLLDCKIIVLTFTTMIRGARSR